GHSFNAWHTAFVKKDMKPSPIPYFSLNLSLYLARRSMMGFISTSLKVVSMAVSFRTATSLRAIVLRRDDIFSLRVLRAPTGAGAAGSGADAFSASAARAGALALRASSLVIRP